MLGYVTNAIEQALLLLVDMADLRGMRNHEVLLTLKKDLTLVRLPTRKTFFLLRFFYT